MYQENELKKLYERLKMQYPQYQLEFSGDSLFLKRLYCKVEVNQSGVKIYVNGNLYDQFTSEYVDDLDDLYELIEAFLLDLQHAGMKQSSARRHEAGKRNLYFRNKAGRQDGKPLSDWNSDVLYHFDDWSNHCEQPLAISVDFSSSGSVAPDTKTNAKKDLPTLLDMPCLRPALAHGRERSSL